MNNHLLQQLSIHPLPPQAPVPFELLLLADPSRKMINGYLDRGMLYVATLQGEITGEYLLLPESQSTIAIKNIAVQPQWQGKGIGKSLLQHASLEAARLGYEYLQIGTGNSSVAQLYLYQRCGFDIKAIWRNYFTEHYPEAIYENGIQCRHMILLEKTLTA